jgi:hypothetical protein
VAPIVTAVPAANKAGDVGVAKNEVEPTVASIDVNPAIVVLEAPNAIAVVPIVTELFAKFALVIPAVPERLLFVKPLIVFEPAAIVLFVNVSVVALPTSVSVAAGKVKVVVPAVAVATIVVVPEVDPLNAAPVLPIVGRVRVGVLANTSAPVPVSSVIAEIKLAELGVVKNVAMPVPRPEIPDAIGRPVALVRVAEAGVPRAPPVKYSAPEPTSSDIAATKLADDGVAKNVATPVPNPLIPEATGSPVQLVRIPDAGVPRTGAVKVGLVRVLLVRV